MERLSVPFFVSWFTLNLLACVRAGDEVDSPTPSSALKGSDQFACSDFNQKLRKIFKQVVVI